MSRFTVLLSIVLACTLSGCMAKPEIHITEPSQEILERCATQGKAARLIVQLQAKGVTREALLAEAPSWKVLIEALFDVPGIHPEAAAAIAETACFQKHTLSAK